MSHRRTTAFLLAIAAFLGAFITGRALLFNLAYLLIFLIVLSFLWAWVSIKWVYLSRTTRTRRTQVGRPLEERFMVRNTSIIPKLWLELRDSSTLPHHRASHVVNTLGVRATDSWRVTTICRTRGRYQLGPVRLRTSDPFGFFPMERLFPATSHVVVYPLTYEIYQFALPMGMLPGGEALRRRTHYVTTNASGVRDYAPGDSFSRIHWRSTARRDRLIVKEFELDPLADIWIVADMAMFVHIAPTTAVASKPGYGDLPLWMQLDEEFTLDEATEEYTVTIAASLAQYFLRYNRSVGLLSYGQSNEIVQPDRGERQLNRILETLAVLRAQGHVPVQDMLNAEAHLLPRGTTVIVVTPTAQEAWATAARQLARRGLRIVTISVDPGSFGASKSSAGLVQLLQAAGLATYTIQNGDNITAKLGSSDTRIMGSSAFPGTR